MEKLLRKYLDPRTPGSLGGVDRFYQGVKSTGVKRSTIEKLLQSSDPYIVNKETRKRFKRNRILVTTLHQQLQIDLADMKLYKNENHGVQYLMFAIDCFSRRASVQTLLSKGASHVKQALKKVMKDLGEPMAIQVDKGKEWYNKTVADLLKRHRVRLFSSENDDVKCALAERLIRTFKARIWRLFRHRLSTQYVDKLPALVYSYNRTIHSAHGMRPIDVRESNSLRVYDALYPVPSKKIKKNPRYRVGDHVRIAKIKGKFEKGYEYRFQEQIYKIAQVINHNVPVYRITSLKGVHVEGTFYEPELSLVRGDVSDRTFPIEKIIKERTRKGKRECLVRWLGYDSDEDSWIECSKVPHST